MAEVRAALDGANAQIRQMHEDLQAWEEAVAARDTELRNLQVRRHAASNHALWHRHCSVHKALWSCTACITSECLLLNLQAAKHAGRQQLLLLLLLLTFVEGALSVSG